MPPSTTAARTARPALSRRNAVGAALAIVLGVWQVVGLAALPAALPAGASGPPTPVIVVSAGLGLVTAVAGALALLRRSRGPLRVAAVGLLLSLLLAVPAFLVEGVPAREVVSAALGTVVGLLTVVLLMSRGSA